MGWTSEQEYAIITHGCDLLVAAAAGSGKTAVLVERIITMITQKDNPVDIDRLLVVTFTSAAAAEMRERIGDAIVKKLNDTPEDERLQRQLTLLNRADITTIHSFCLRVIRENYTVLDIDPAFRIADETEISLIKSELIEDIFEELYSSENNMGFLSLVESYGESTNDKSLRELILKTHTFVQSSPFPDLWLDDMSEKFNITNSDNEFNNTQWVKLICNDIKMELYGLLDCCKMSLDTIYSENGPLEYENGIISDIDIINDLINICEKNSDNYFRSIYDGFDQAVFGQLGRKKKGSDEDKINFVKSMRDDVKAAFTDIKKNILFKSPDEMKNDIIKLYPIIKSLCEIVKIFEQKFQIKKREKLIVDFNDLEHYCLKILIGENSTLQNIYPSEAASVLQQKYHEILIDEYQDSNLVQEMILSAVSKKSSGNNNRFMVGDVKQSIYRFRLAKPELFMEKYNTYNTENLGKEIRIDLFKNFRSRANVLNSINFIFKQLMTQDLGEIVYDDKAALNLGANFPEFDGLCGGETEINLIDLSNKSETDEYYDDLIDEGEELSNAESEVNFIAQRIIKLKNDGFCVQDKSGKYRPLEYKDIVVLLRAPSGWSGIFVEVFTNHGIPVFADTSTGYYETTEIMTILNILKTIDNPRQDIPVIGVLRSPIYKMTADELVQIKVQGKKTSFYDDLIVYKSNNKNEKVSKFYDDIERWRELAVYTPIDELLWIIYNDTSYFDYIGVTLGGSIRQANLRALLDKASEYESTSFKGLFHFVKYIEKIQRNDNDSGAAKILSENENLVKILSIHKSKGLEFPVVFVAGLGKKFNRRDLASRVLLHQDMGFGSIYVDYENRVTYNTIARMAVAKKIEKENLSEEMRILYVALTRAKEKLILTGGVRNLDKSLIKWSTPFVNSKEIELPHYNMLNSKNFLDWIVPAVSRHRDCELISEKGGCIQLNTNNGLYDDMSRWSVNITSKENISVVRLEESHKSEAASQMLLNWNSNADYSGKRDSIFKKLMWKYAFENASKLPANVSISEIKRLYYENRISQRSEPAENFKMTFKTPAFLQGSKKLTAAEKGTAVHTILERLDFKKTYLTEDVKNIIDECVQLNILTKDEGISIKPTMIMEFLKSDVCKRVLQSDEVNKEVPFALEINASEIYENESTDEGILVHGIIDCYFIEDGQAVLLDYKTDYIKENHEEYIKLKYSVQLDIYARAIESITGLVVKEKIIYLFGKGEIKI